MGEGTLLLGAEVVIVAFASIKNTFGSNRQKRQSTWHVLWVYARRLSYGARVTRDMREPGVGFAVSWGKEVSRPRYVAVTKPSDGGS
jgi:hypothetical protein